MASMKRKKIDYSVVPYEVTVELDGASTLVFYVRGDAQLQATKETLEGLLDPQTVSVFVSGYYRQYGGPLNEYCIMANGLKWYSIGEYGDYRYDKREAELGE